MRRFIETMRHHYGRADLFGLLVVAVVLAVSLTIVVQAHGSSPTVPSAENAPLAGELSALD